MPAINDYGGYKITMADHKMYDEGDMRVERDSQWQLMQNTASLKASDADSSKMSDTLR